MNEYITKEAAIEAVEDTNIELFLSEWKEIEEKINAIPAADVVPVVHGRCPICSGRKDLTQDRYNEHFVEVDAELGERSIWRRYLCLAVIPIKHCPNCGARMHGGKNDG